MPPEFYGVGGVKTSLVIALAAVVLVYIALRAGWPRELVNISLGVAAGSIVLAFRTANRM